MTKDGLMIVSAPFKTQENYGAQSALHLTKVSRTLRLTKVQMLEVNNAATSGRTTCGA